MARGKGREVDEAEEVVRGQIMGDVCEEGARSPHSGPGALSVLSLESRGSCDGGNDTSLPSSPPPLTPAPPPTCPHQPLPWRRGSHCVSSARVSPGQALSHSPLIPRPQCEGRGLVPVSWLGKLRLTAVRESAQRERSQAQTQGHPGSHPLSRPAGILLDCRGACTRCGL